MDNASKALLMAGSVLLAIMIISLAMYLFANFHQATSQIEGNVEESQVMQFNNQFTKYESNNQVTIYEVLSMANLATQNNKQYQYEKQLARGENSYISVFLDGKGYIEGGSSDLEKDIQERYSSYITEQLNHITHTTGLTYYEVTVDISPTTQRVYKVTCTER